MDILKAFHEKIKIVHSDRQGNRGYNRNFGASFALNDYLMFVDGDIIFLKGAISALRFSMETGYIGVVGNVVRSNNTPPQMNLLTGTDYDAMLHTDLSFERLIHLGILTDRRQQHIFDKMAVNGLWEYFFSAYCAVKRSAFDAVGGFETNFAGWGVEDDQFGYKLQKYGALDYNVNAYAVHAPHDRDLFRCLISNRLNLYRFLAMEPSNEIELHMTYGNSLKLTNTIDYIRKQLIDAHTQIFDFDIEENCIYFNELTAQYPCGYVLFTAATKEPHLLELLGLAVPFRNKNFQYAYCTENLMIYPEALVSLILSEMLRVAMEVRILKLDKPKRIRWNESLISGLTRISSSGRLIYAANGLCDFCIEDCGTYYQIKDGMATVLNDHFLVDENYYMPELFTRSVPRYLLINLTGALLTDQDYLFWGEKHGVLIQDCYQIMGRDLSGDIRLSEVIAGDLYRLHTPMAYLVPLGVNIDKSDKWWTPSFRDHDIIIQNS